MQPKKRHLILASASPRRLEILQSAGVFDIEVIPADIDEDIPYSSPEELVLTLSKLKAQKVAKAVSGIVLAADTIVVCGSVILGKPVSKEDSLRMFRMLCGRSHEVITGVTVASGGKTVSAYQKSCVTFDDFNEQIVYNYVDSGKPFDKAGGYGVQDLFGILIRSVEGGYDNVVGLPLELSLQMLEEFYGSN